MVQKIEAGEQSIHLQNGAWLVINWCDRFLSDLSDQTAGILAFPSNVAIQANEMIPASFDEAFQSGFLSGDFLTKIDEAIFISCREFLRYAAEAQYGITICI